MAEIRELMCVGWLFQGYFNIAVVSRLVYRYSMGWTCSHPVHAPHFSLQLQRPPHRVLVCCLAGITMHLVPRLLFGVWRSTPNFASKAQTKC